MRADRCRVVVLLAALAHGCTLAGSYPDSVVEQCVGGVDEDLDGETDCEDSDCWGRCPEETRAACTNGRDDDGDGVADHVDARCWPYATIEFERCQSVAGTDVKLRADDDLCWAGGVEVVSDRAGSRAFPAA